VTRVNSFAEYETAFGRDDSPLRTAAVQLFNGGGLPGQGGAGSVIVYRMVGSDGAKATATRNNTATTAALRLDAKYAGTTGNEITYSVEDDTVDPSTNDVLRILFNGVEVERYLYAQTDIVTLAALVNVSSGYVTATSLATGTALSVTGSPVALTGGDNGETLVVNDYSDAVGALEFEEFGIIVYPGIDASVRSVLYAWVQTQIDQFRPVMLVEGGALAETVLDALARSAAVPSATKPHVVNVGVGRYYDDLLEEELSTAQLASRIAGILAYRGETQSLTFADLFGLHVVSGTGPTVSQLKTLRDGGVTALRRVSNPNTELKVSQGVTTFTSKADPARPYQIFSEPRMVRVMDNFIRRMKAWSDDVIIGDTTVTDQTRATVRGHALDLINTLISNGVVLPTPEPFVRTPIPADPNLLDTVPFEFGWRFARTTNNVIGNGLVS
jgi:hypothetical protein